MKTLTVTNIERTYSNFGQHAEQALAYTLTGEIRTHDHVAFYVDSDIPEYHMSVKASNFTLASGNINPGETFEEKWQDFRSRVVSTTFAFVTTEMVAYLMDIDEFEAFVFTFCKLERDSEKNGGLLKIRCKKESGKMLQWLQAHAA